MVLNAEMSSSTARSHKQTAFRLNGVRYSLHLADCLAWMDQQSANSIHAIVTDPPYGLKEYTAPEKQKLRRGKGGVWRIPPSFDGCVRSPLPRFTVLTDDELSKLRHFFADFARRAFRIMVPRAHIFIATNPLLSHLVYVPFLEAGFEKRGEIIRLVQTLRGGDRPKNAHREFAEVTVMPRSSWEPWGLFRKPCEGRVQDNLRKWKTGGLRRVSSELPFSDNVIFLGPDASGRAHDLSASFAQAAVIRSSARPGLSSTGIGNCSGSFHGRRFDHCGGYFDRLREYRHRNRSGIFWCCGRGHPSAGGAPGEWKS
jgi:hypothetical protein